MISVVQMRQYRLKKSSSTPATASVLRVVAPSSPVKSRALPTKYEVSRPIIKAKRSAQAATVDGEYCKYVSTISCAGTDILRFWEVSRLLKLNGAAIHSLNRPIGSSFRHYLTWLLTISQSRQLQCHVSVYSRWQRRRTLQNGIRSAQR